MTNKQSNNAILKDFEIEVSKIITLSKSKLSDDIFHITNSSYLYQHKNLNTPQYRDKDKSLVKENKLSMTIETGINKYGYSSKDDIKRHFVISLDLWATYRPYRRKSFINGCYKHSYILADNIPEALQKLKSVLPSYIH